MDAKYVSASKPKIGGAIHSAPLGTKLPTSVDEALDAAFKDLGYVSDSGVTNSNGPSSDKAKAWGGDVVLNFSNERPDAFKFMLIEVLNEEVLKVVYKENNVKGTLAEGISIDVGNEDYENRCWVIDMLLKGAAKRIVIPSGKITSLEDIEYVDNKPVGYNITIAAEPISSGKYHHEYIKAVSTETTTTGGESADS